MVRSMITLNSFMASSLLQQYLDLTAAAALIGSMGKIQPWPFLNIPILRCGTGTQFARGLGEGYATDKQAPFGGISPL